WRLFAYFESGSDVTSDRSGILARVSGTGFGQAGQNAGQLAPTNPNPPNPAPSPRPM
ncbi:hypothetical protein BaRGS_00004650, partial [Batillaria attramentaria]